MTVPGPAATPSVAFIGDVHGWSDRLAAVLRQVPGPLVFMGDLIDRGPDSRGVLGRVRDLCVGGRARCLLGNHEYAMLRAIGVPRLGIDPDPDWWEAWTAGYGGRAVLDSFDATTPEGLAAALGGLRDWLAGLPWLLSGSAGGRRWLAVHAGLSPDEPVHDQLAALADPDWGDDRPVWLYDKYAIFGVPPDLPADICLVSGHSPQNRALVTPRRILCDTSGGRPGRWLSAVIFPEGRVVTG
jgi:hypothetical protein